MADLSKNNQGEGAPTGEDAIRQAVENSRNSDESQEDDDDDSDEDDSDDADDDNSGDDAAGDDSDDSEDDGDDADDSDDEEDDDAESGNKKDPKSDRKFSQFKGDGTDKAYISNLEEGYKNSSAEAIRLKGERDTAQGRLDTMLRVVAADPTLSKALNDQLNGKGQGGSGSGSDDDENSQDDLANPFIQNLQAEWQEKSEKEIQEIIDGNPELVTDEALSNEVKKWMSIFSNQYRQDNNGRLMSGGAAMLAAMKHLGVEDKREKQNLANGAKKNLTPPRSRGNKAKKSGGQKPKFTDSQIAMAKSMGKDLAWLEKNAG